MGEILTNKKICTPQMSHIQLNFAFLLFWTIFDKSHRELLFSVKKVTISERSIEKLRKFVFLNMFEKGKILRNFWICLNNCFWSNQLKGSIINKDCFCPQSEPHTAKLCFFVVLKHFCWNSQRTSLFIQKSVSETSNEIRRKFVFLNMFEKGKILRNIWICLNNCFWSNQLNGTIINKDCFSSKSKPCTAKLCFSVVLKHFCWNSQRTSLFRQRVTISEKSTEIITKFFFSLHVWKGENSDENLDLFKQLFLIKPVKGEKY